jgi:tetratricopeptide (TPR) repeat protein
LATAYERVGQVQGHSGHDNLGDPAGSLASYQKALAIRKQIATKSQGWKDRLALARAYRSVSELQWSTGNPHQAQDDLNLAIGTCENLNQAHPSEPEILREMATGYRDFEGLSVYPDPPGAEEKRIQASSKALAADEAVLRIEPDDLSTLSAYAADLSHIGGALQRTDPQAALPYYQRELQIIKKVSEASTAVGYGRRVALAYRDLSSAYEDLADFSRAVEYDVKALKVLQQLSQADAQNASVKHSLAIAYTNTAEGFAEIENMKLALEYSEKATEIMHKLVSAAPENRSERHYLASVLASGGTVLMQAHKPEAAFARFEEARTIYESFRDTGVADIFEIANLAACTEKMGEASALSGNDRAAARYFHQALSIAEPLLSASSGELNPLYAVADTYAGLGDLSLKRARLPGQAVAQQKANWTEARDWYAKSLETWRRVEHPDRFAPSTNIAASNPKIIAKKLQQSESALSRLRQYH